MYVFDNYYSFSELIKLGYSLVVTKLFYRPATLIRRPFYVRGWPRIAVGEGFTTGYNCRIEAFGNRDDTGKKIVFGSNCHIGDNVHIAAANRIEIGDDCLFASRIFISDLNHGSYGPENSSSPATPPNDRPLTSSPIVIGPRVWIGENVSVLSGVTIGEGCVIGSNSVITHDVPPNSIAVGSPARVIKTYRADQAGWN